jgi:NitT/TauT family transport system substrate-binding protein
MTPDQARRVRLFSLVAVVVLTVAACGGYGDGGGGAGAEGAGGDQASEDAELATVRLGMLPIADFAPLLVAQHQGYFADNGIEIQATNLEGGAAAIPALEGGSLDVIGTNLVSVVQAHQAGLDIRCFSGIVRKPSDGQVLALLTGADSGVTEPADLAGATIAVNTLENINQLVAMAWLQQHGVDPGSVDFIAVGFPDMSQALSSGQVQAALVDEPFVTTALDGGAQVLDPRPYQAINDAPAFSCIASTGEWVDANADTAAAFVRSVQQGIEYLEANPDEWQVLLTEDMNVDAEVAERLGLPEPTTELTAEEVQVWIDAAASYGLIEEAFGAEEVIALAGN